MRLPDELYHAAKPVFAHHAPWHAVRRPANAHLRGPGTAFPNLKGTNEAGSGEQFLRFHRDMVRVFKWLLINTPGSTYAYSPWEQLPSWLADVFEAARPGYLAIAYAHVEQLINAGSADDLGNYIEATALAVGQNGSDLHNRAHGTIDHYESDHFGADTERLVDARMGSFATAPHNEHFWGLHGWIDNRFAAWQLAHGEAVNQSPLAPHDAGHGHLMIMEFEALPEISEEEEREILKPIWR
jgi:hypothetical protein